MERNKLMGEQWTPADQRPCVTWPAASKHAGKLTDKHPRGSAPSPPALQPPVAPGLQHFHPERLRFNRQGLEQLRPRALRLQAPGPGAASPRVLRLQAPGPGAASPRAPGLRARGPGGRRRAGVCLPPASLRAIDDSRRPHITFVKLITPFKQSNIPFEGKKWSHYSGASPPPPPPSSQSFFLFSNCSSVRISGLPVSIIKLIVITFESVLNWPSSSSPCPLCGRFSPAGSISNAIYNSSTN